MAKNEQPQISLAEMNALLEAHGTSEQELDLRVIELTMQLIEKLGRPVQEEEIADYIAECEPKLLSILEWIDSVRHSEQCAAKRKRLTKEQRSEVLKMIDSDVPVKMIAVTFGVTAPAIYSYRNKRRAAQ